MNPSDSENQSVSTSNGSSASHKAHFSISIDNCAFTQGYFLGYSPLNHTESENALNAGVVLDCFEKLSWFDGFMEALAYIP